MHIKQITAFVTLGLLSAMVYYGMKFIFDSLDPTKKKPGQLTHEEAEQLLIKIGLEGIKLTDHELALASTLVDPLNMSITWADIGGLDGLIKDLKETVIFPMRQKSLFAKSSLLSSPKGVLLYGPPGCGKTMIAKATAKTAGCRFINVQVATLTDKWYGESQKLTAALFSLAKKLAPCIIFIDEIDSFLRSRNISDHEVTAMVKAQFMNLWDGLVTDGESQVMVMGASNRPEDVDTAILRRMVATFHIGLPNERQREEILGIVLKNEKVENDLDFKHVASLTEGCSGSDLKEICRCAAMSCLRECFNSIDCDDQNYEDLLSLNEENIRAISTYDIVNAVEKCRSQFIHHR
ncbi:outer mitochondrial transmembrane helix translocase-like [Xenia sp. Carnegie-2017]|uniref:outer mitochondrial transmembrane helix translocase-like n=1 Tax=Xenia sp. Carnegie-2017 TaxID=2897299 RepID=UPI001F046F79|nr:outer mitochondrial transmembrane helix translocase-like [Xenia sp. Carnegie-2017]